MINMYKYVVNKISILIPNQMMQPRKNCIFRQQDTQTSNEKMKQHHGGNKNTQKIYSK